MKYQLGTKDSCGFGYKTISIEEFIKKMEDADSIFHRFNRYRGGRDESMTASLDVYKEGYIFKDTVLLQFNGGVDECRMFEEAIRKLDNIVVFKEREFDY